MKYKLINSVSKKETICDKVTIDGFDYFVSNEKINEETLFVDNNKLFKCRNIFEIGIEDDEGLLHKFENSEKVIATNNPNIDIPQVVDIVQQLASDVVNNNTSLITDREKISCFTGWIDGYLKSKETHSNSDEDMIDFKNWWLKLNIEWFDNTEDGDIYRFNNGKKVTDKELLQMWKEQQPKVVYYA